MCKRISACRHAPSPYSTLSWLGVDLREALTDFRRGLTAVADVDRTAAAMRLAAAVEAALPDIEEAKDKAKEAEAVIGARAKYETAVEAGVEEWRFDGWIEYLDDLAADEREALEAIAADERAEAMAAWRDHADEWDMCRQ